VATEGETIRVSGPDGIGETICAPGEPLLVEQIERIP